jgi:hypothetical protein
VAGVATGPNDREGPVLRPVFWHTPILAALDRVLVAVQAWCFAGVVPANLLFLICDR